jgi:hypothetical protein
VCVCVPCAAIVRAEVWSRKFPFWDDEQLEAIRVPGGSHGRSIHSGVRLFQTRLIGAFAMLDLCRAAGKVLRSLFV